MITNILEYLEDAALAFPSKTAYADENYGITYGELESTAVKIGSGLLKCLMPNTGRAPVMIYMEKSPACIAAFMGVLESGNFYVPVDIEMPGQRVGSIIENLKPALIICDEDRLPETEKIALQRVRVISYEELSGADEDKKTLEEIRSRHIDTDPAYAIYTSGSTGVPKGVIVSHRSLIDYAEHFSLAAGFKADDIAGNQVPFHFDASLIDIYCTLKNGGTMVIIPVRLFSVPAKLLEFMEERRITIIRWVPSALNMVAAFKALKLTRPSALREIIFGAEAMPTKCFNYWKSYYPEAVFIQIYGPTEITGVCTYYVVDRDFDDTETIPIGKHLKNSGVFLLDENDRLITEDSPGVQGEICVRGSGLANGYINSPEITEKVFTQNPLNGSFPERIYRTGDLAFYNEKKELVFASRKDFQIKHMGHRIELGEIEAAALSHPGMKSAICLFDEEKNKIILVYVSDTLDDINILGYLKERIPRYMIPNIFKRIEEMPLTSGGKTDRVRLRESILGRK